MPIFFSAVCKLLEHLEANDPPSARLVLSMGGVPLVEATGVEVLRELHTRQQAGGGDLLLAAVQPRVELLLGRMGFMGEIGRERVFWSADRAIMSLGLPLPQEEPQKAAVNVGLADAQQLQPRKG